MEITVPNTLSDWTRNAIIHCLVLPPLSSVCAAITGGAIRYRNSILKMRAIQLRMMTIRSKISATHAT